MKYLLFPTFQMRTLAASGVLCRGFTLSAIWVLLLCFGLCLLHFSSLVYSHHRYLLDEVYWRADLSPARLLDWWVQHWTENSLETVMHLVQKRPLSSDSGGLCFFLPASLPSYAISAWYSSASVAAGHICFACRLLGGWLLCRRTQASLSSMLQPHALWF